MTESPLAVAGFMVFGAAIAAMAALVLISWALGGRTAPPEEPTRPPATARAGTVVHPEWQQLTAHAADAAARAARARAEAATLREHLAAAEVVRESAWHQYETAESPVLVPRAPEPPADGVAVTPRGVAHAAFVAFRRGAISVRELQRVWQGAARPDPDQVAREREAARLAARQREARRAYDRAASATRLVQEQALVAQVAAEALASEAAEAEQEARDAQAGVEQQPRGW